MVIHRKFYPYRNADDGDGNQNGGAAAAGAESQQTDQNDTAQDEQRAAIEAEARRMGWTDKSEFKGDPAKWKPADEFVEHGRIMLPMVQAKVRRQEQQIAELRQTIHDFRDHLSKTRQVEYDRAMRDLKAARAEAVANGDGEAFAKVDEQLEKLRTEAEKESAKHKKPAQDDGPDPVYTEWESRNPWLKDAELNEYAEFTAQRLRKNGETASGAEFLDLITKQVKARFPEKFTNPRREAAQPVESGVAQSRRGGKTYHDMPADARAACDRMAKQYDAKAAAEFKAQYVKTYFEGA